MVFKHPLYSLDTEIDNESSYYIFISTGYICETSTDNNANIYLSPSYGKFFILLLFSFELLFVAVLMELD